MKAYRRVTKQVRMAVKIVVVTKTGQEVFEKERDGRWLRSISDLNGRVRRQEVLINFGEVVNELNFYVARGYVIYV